MLNAFEQRIKELEEEKRKIEKNITAFNDYIWDKLSPKRSKLSDEYTSLSNQYIEIIESRKNLSEEEKLKIKSIEKETLEKINNVEKKQLLIDKEIEDKKIERDKLIESTKNRLAEIPNQIEILQKKIKITFNILSEFAINVLAEELPFLADETISFSEDDINSLKSACQRIYIKK